MTKQQKDGHRMQNDQKHQFVTKLVKQLKIFQDITLPKNDLMQLSQVFDHARHDGDAYFE